MLTSLDPLYHDGGASTMCVTVCVCVCVCVLVLNFFTCCKQEMSVQVTIFFMTGGSCCNTC